MIADLGAVDICFETHGAVEDPAIVLIRGLGTQLIEWPPSLIASLVAEGLFVVTFDNRDAGLSTELVDARSSPPYRVEDMAGDVIGLLDHLQVERAHILGISMGGMIAQHVALSHPARTRSLISVMSSSGNPDLPRPAADVFARLNRTATGEDAIIALTAENKAVFGSPGYPESLAVRMTSARRAYERSYRPAGVARQMQAIVADGSRVDRLRTIRVPTLVIHGADDPLVPLAAGKDTAANIPGSRLIVIDGMGHNLPDALVPEFVGHVAAFIESL
ncbi:MAG: alpha/beta fold hydrolase [Gammaproteobacteria bacterium]|nr:alpha/beta fold hydrolase [Gammaproteobacteria bacterium]